MSFVLTFPNLETEDLLKEEVRLKFPNWKISFSKSGFISFKVEPDLSLQDLLKTKLIFSKRLALFQQKIPFSDLPPKHDFFDLENLVLTQASSSTLDDIGEMSVRVGKELWMAKFSRVHDRLALNSELPHEAPSRAYLKLAQLVEFAKINFAKNQIIVELGASPGGMSYYVCSKGAYLYAVDPGAMSPVLLKNFPDHFKHVNKSVFDLKRYDLPDTIHWLTVDLNLEASVSLDETLKLAKRYQGPNFRGIFINLKTPRVEDVAKIQHYADLISKAGFRDYQFFQLPSHRREFAALVLV